MAAESSRIKRPRAERSTEAAKKRRVEDEGFSYLCVNRMLNPRCMTVPSNLAYKVPDKYKPLYTSRDSCQAECKNLGLTLPSDIQRIIQEQVGRRPIAETSVMSRISSMGPRGYEAPLVDLEKMFPDLMEKYEREEEIMHLYREGDYDLVAKLLRTPAGAGAANRLLQEILNDHEYQESEESRNEEYEELETFPNRVHLNFIQLIIRDPRLRSSISEGTKVSLLVTSLNAAKRQILKGNVDVGAPQLVLELIDSGFASSSRAILEIAKILRQMWDTQYLIEQVRWAEGYPQMLTRARLNLTKPETFVRQLVDALEKNEISLLTNPKLLTALFDLVWSGYCSRIRSIPIVGPPQKVFEEFILSLVYRFSPELVNKIRKSDIEKELSLKFQEARDDDLKSTFNPSLWDEIISTVQKGYGDCSYNLGKWREWKTEEYQNNMIRVLKMLIVRPEYTDRLKDDYYGLENIVKLAFDIANRTGDLTLLKWFFENPSMDVYSDIKREFKNRCLDSASAIASLSACKYINTLDTVGMPAVEIVYSFGDINRSPMRM
jgi:hypothetical protein